MPDKQATLNPLSPTENLQAKGLYRQAVVWCSQACKDSLKLEARRPFAVESDGLLFTEKDGVTVQTMTSLSDISCPGSSCFPPGKHSPWHVDPLTCFLWPSRSREQPCTHINSKHLLGKKPPVYR